MQTKLFITVVTICLEVITNIFIYYYMLFSLLQVNDPTVSLFKGYGLSKEAEDYLSSHGLKNAIYCIDASDVQDDLFGQLSACPFRVRFWTLSNS